MIFTSGGGLFFRSCVKPFLHSARPDPTLVPADTFSSLAAAAIVAGVKAVIVNHKVYSLLRDLTITRPLARPVWVAGARLIRQRLSPALTCTLCYLAAPGHANGKPRPNLKEKSALVHAARHCEGVVAQAVGGDAHTDAKETRRIGLNVIGAGDAVEPYSLQSNSYM